MKLKAIVILLLCFSTKAIAQEVNLDGAWHNQKAQIVYEFKADNQLYFSQMGYVVAAGYTLDTSVNPHRMDLVITQGGQKMTIPALIEIVDEQTIIIEQFSPYSKPTEFSPDDATPNSKYILTRKE